MKIVFFGTPGWAVPTLEALAASSCPPSLVVTQPTKRRGRGGEPSPSAIAAAARSLGLDVIEPESVRTEEFLGRMASEAADLFVVVAFGRIFPQRLLDVPRLGPVNVHFSLLPRWRGAAPVQWAVAEGDTTTGVTTMRMVKDLDAGPVYMQQSVAIEPGEHAPHLGARLAQVGAKLLLETVERIGAGSLVPREQEISGVTLARLLRPQDGWVDWTMTAERIACLVRGFDPWPGQSATARRGKLRILEARPEEGAHPGGAAPLAEGTAGGGPGTVLGGGGPVAERAASAGPGTVLGGAGRALRIACGAGTVLEALVVQPEARAPIAGAEALRGRYLQEGERLGGDPAAN